MTLFVGRGVNQCNVQPETFTHETYRINEIGVVRNNRGLLKTPLEPFNQQTRRQVHISAFFFRIQHSHITRQSTYRLG